MKYRKAFKKDEIKQFKAIQSKSNLEIAARMKISIKRVEQFRESYSPSYITTGGIETIKANR